MYTSGGNPANSHNLASLLALQGADSSMGPEGEEGAGT